MFITAPDLELIYGNRSSRSCQRDYRVLADILGVKKGMPGIPIHKYATYIDVPVGEIEARLRAKH